MNTKKMTTNGNNAPKISTETSDDKRLREILQKAVNKEKAPESLRDRIRKMIRE